MTALRASFGLATLIAFFVTGCLDPWSDSRPRARLDTAFVVGQVTFPNDSATARAFMTSERNGRLSAFLQKCKSGKPVTIGFLGGSITQGGRLDNEADRYSDVLASFLREDYPNLSVTVANASLSATGTRYAATRARFQLFGSKPDMVVIEFAVNDVGTASDEEIKASLEGLVRQCLRLGEDVPVILMFTPKMDGYNVQQIHAEVGSHYKLPMLSYRDAVYPFIADGRLSTEDLFIDDPHPTVAGHRIIAQLLHTYLKREAAKSGGTGVEIPAPLVTDLFERAGIVAPGDTTVVTDSARSGWIRKIRNADALGPTRYMYYSTRPGRDTLTLSTRAREITLGLHMQPQDTSSIQVYINGVLHSSHNDYYSFVYTRFIRLPIVPTSTLRTIQVIQTGPNAFALDNILYAGTPD